MNPSPPEVAAALLLAREDGRVLLVRHHDSHVQFAGRWSLPMHAVAEEEVAEDAVERMLREVLHLRSTSFEFADTVYVTGEAGSRYIVNVFTATQWDGDPHYSDTLYADAAWVDPASPGTLDVIAELRSWLVETAGPAAISGEAVDAAALHAALAAARRELLAAFDAIDAASRTQALDEAWSPLDVLSHVASTEAYYAAESARLLVPGHTWRQFNSAQWEDDHRSRPSEPEAIVRERLDAARGRTLAWLRTLSAEQLATFGNHPERGVVTVGNRIEAIAAHEREHVQQLQRMRQLAGVVAGLALDDSPTDPGEAGDAAADR